MAQMNWQTDNTLCKLSQSGLLTLSGDDAVTFLQGQVTNDVAQLDGAHAHYSAYCSPKGRMLALFLAFAHQNKLYLQFSQPLVESVMKRLTMYVMRAKVDIADVSDEMHKFGINGPNANKLVLDALDITSEVLPEQDYDIAKSDQYIIIKLPSIADHSRYEIIVNATQAEDTWHALKKNFTLVDTQCWDWLDIQTGTPDVLSSTQEQFVPQMLNLDVLNGINFKKGCYTGQEIIARTHYLGSVKRRTYLAAITSDTAPQAGDKLLDKEKNGTGQIVRVAPNLSNGFDVLAEMRIEAKNAGDIYWHETPLHFKEMPYSLDAEN